MNYKFITDDEIKKCTLDITNVLQEYTREVHQMLGLLDLTKQVILMSAFKIN